MQKFEALATDATLYSSNNLCARSKTVMLLSEPAAITVGDKISFNAAKQFIVWADDCKECMHLYLYSFFNFCRSSRPLAPVTAGGRRYLLTASNQYHLTAYTL